MKKEEAEALGQDIARSNWVMWIDGAYPELSDDDYWENANDTAVEADGGRRGPVWDATAKEWERLAREHPDLSPAAAKYLRRWLEKLRAGTYLTQKKSTAARSPAIIELARLKIIRVEPYHGSEVKITAGEAADAIDLDALPKPSKAKNPRMSNPMQGPPVLADDRHATASAARLARGEH